MVSHPAPFFANLFLFESKRAKKVKKVILNEQWDLLMSAGSFPSMMVKREYERSFKKYKY